MFRRFLTGTLLGAMLVGGWGLYQPGSLVSAKEQPKPNKPAGAVAMRAGIDPKPLTETSLKGLTWLVKHQNPDGGWGQGEEASSMGQAGGNIAYQSNVADTSAACLALLRAGNTSAKEESSESLRKGVAYVCSQIEQADEDSIFVTQLKGTRVQAKLGPTIDTFLANLLLAEAKSQSNQPAEQERISKALTKVLHKIEKNQKADGTWTNEGWAPVLAQSVATKGLNRAAQTGTTVSEVTLSRVDDHAQQSMNAPAAGAPRGDAGVELYQKSAGYTGVQDSLNTLESREKDLRVKAERGSDQEKKDANKQLDRLGKAREAEVSARKTVVGRLQDAQFVSGFGSNGGEEFLSYMNISESLVVKGGAEWEKWDRSMGENLSRIQNPDGSWSGHHCITGRTFCTASALLVLTADRAPVPVAAGLKK